MLSEEHQNSTQSVTYLDLNSQEIERLTSLRDYYYSHSEFLERVLGERRLEFAKWLADHNKLEEWG